MGPVEQLLSRVTLSEYRPNPSGRSLCLLHLAEKGRQSFPSDHYEEGSCMVDAIEMINAM